MEYEPLLPLGVAPLALLMLIHRMFFMGE